LCFGPLGQEQTRVVVIEKDCEAKKMSENMVCIKMLGAFSIQRNGQCVDDRTNRMRKIWLLIAYMLYNRGKYLPRENFLSLLGKNDEDSDPNGSLKALFFRARGLLDNVEEDLGHRLIIRKDGSYAWNTEVPLWLDVDEFEKLCRAGDRAQSSDQKVESYLAAIELYRGDFLPKLSDEAWVMPIAAYYHKLYIDAMEKLLTLLEDRGDSDTVIATGRQALKIEPYSEFVYQCLMRASLAKGDRDTAIADYENMSELLFSTFGVIPSDQSRALYHQASQSVAGTAIPADLLRERLKEEEKVKGAMFCGYDFFRVLYQVQARSIARSGDVVHIALISVHSGKKKGLSRKSLDIAAENLKEILLSNLRQGDIVSQCSASQLLVMLPQANYEDSCTVCRRLVDRFYRKYPHSPVELHCNVHPLEPVERN